MVPWNEIVLGRSQRAGVGNAKKSKLCIKKKNTSNRTKMQSHTRRHTKKRKENKNRIACVCMRDDYNKLTKACKPNINSIVN